MKYLKLFVLIVVAIIFDTTFLKSVEIRGIKPDLLLIILVYSSLKWGAVQGTIIGFLIGFFQDLYSPEMFGLHALAKCITGYLIGITKEHFFWGSYFAQLLIIFFSLLIHDIICLFIGNFGDYSLLLKNILRVTLPAAVYTGSIGPLFYKGIMFLNSSFKANE